MAEELLSGLKLFNRGKVRDIYDLGDKLLLVASDRISAFDVILPTLIPDKGKVLTQMSEFWFAIVKDIVRDHLITTEVEEFPAACQAHKATLEGRSMLVKRAIPACVECIVRGYLFGTGWKEYCEHSHVCGNRLPKGLVEASRLKEPLFIPSTKESLGTHHDDITFQQMADIVGPEKARAMRDLSITIYLRAQEMAEAKGIIVGGYEVYLRLDGRTADFD